MFYLFDDIDCEEEEEKNMGIVNSTVIKEEFDETSSNFLKRESLANNCSVFSWLFWEDIDEKNGEEIFQKNEKEIA